MHLLLKMVTFHCHVYFFRGVYLPSCSRKKSGRRPSPQSLAYPSGSLSQPSKLQESFEPADVSFHRSPWLSSVLINTYFTSWGHPEIYLQQKTSDHPKQTTQLMVDVGGLDWCFGILTAPLSHDPMNPNHQAKPLALICAGLKQIEDPENGKPEQTLEMTGMMQTFWSLHIYYLEIQIPPEPVFGPLKHT